MKNAGIQCALIKGDKSDLLKSRKHRSPMQRQYPGANPSEVRLLEELQISPRVDFSQEEMPPVYTRLYINGQI